MKKILFLMLIMGFFSPLINALTFEEWENENVGNYIYKIQGPASGYIYYYYDKKNGVLSSVRWNQSQQYYIGDYYTYTLFGMIKFRNNYADHASKNVVKKEVFDNYLKNVKFLNDLYEQKTNLILNYLYNDSVFTNDNYIQYENYELLYNDDGLSVESIVDGVWAGLYDDGQKSKSGAMYDKNGSLIYYNGKAVDPVTSFLLWLQKFTNKVVLDTFEEIRKSFVTGIILSVVLVLGLVRLVLELLPSSITPRRCYYRGGYRSLPDYGDGSQVAASVRARLAAKNKALKARANGGADGGDAVKQSLVNGILFDLENDR